MDQIKKYKKDLPTLRLSLDAIDEQIVQHIIQRFKISEQIAQVKMEMFIETEDKNREVEVIESAVAYALSLSHETAHLDGIRSIMPEIIRACKVIQENQRATTEKVKKA